MFECRTFITVTDLGERMIYAFPCMTLIALWTVLGVISTGQAVAVYVFFKALSGKTYNEIEDGTAIFISILSNHAKGSSDIVTIMDNTVPALSGPLTPVVRFQNVDRSHRIFMDSMNEAVA